jgi:hypothetical protein
VLLFELFAPFVTLVSLIAAAWLWMVNARTRDQPVGPQPDSLKPPAPDRPNAHDTSRRPSMSA